MPPVKIDNETFSSILGAISITAWVVVFTPQIWTNFATRSAEGLSITFVVLWLAGDLFNILGAILQRVQWVLAVLAIYYTAADVVLLVQCILYRKQAQLVHVEEEDIQHASVATPLIPKTIDVTQSRSNAKSAVLNTLALLAVCMVGTISWYVGVISSANNGPVNHKPHLKFDVWGQLSGWLCAVLYLGSRVPQIIHNYTRSSTSGLSPLFFLFACLGNTTYVGSILIREYGSRHYHKYLAINSSWLAGSAGTLLLDFIILAQTLYYTHVHRKHSDDDDDEV